MTDNTIYNRQVKIGERIASERKRKGWSQTRLGDEITQLLGLDKEIAQPTILSWEKGRSNIGLDRILAMSKLFGCDCGYLLCDYDERTHDSEEIHNKTGLSGRSIDWLSTTKAWGFTEYSIVMNVLLDDARFKNKDGERSYKSIIESLHSFFSYVRSGKRHLVTSSGDIVPYSTTDGTVSVGATSIDDTMIENAILVEIQNSLISLKRRLKRG